MLVLSVLSIILKSGLFSSNTQLGIIGFFIEVFSLNRSFCQLCQNCIRAKYIHRKITCNGDWTLHPRTVELTSCEASLILSIGRRYPRSQVQGTSTPLGYPSYGTLTPFGIPTPLRYPPQKLSPFGHIHPKTYPPLLLIPSGSYQNIYGWQAVGTHHTGILIILKCCLVNKMLLGRILRSVNG